MTIPTAELDAFAIALGRTRAELDDLIASQIRLGHVADNDDAIRGMIKSWEDFTKAGKAAKIGLDKIKESLKKYHQEVTAAAGDTNRKSKALKDLKKEYNQTVSAMEEAVRLEKEEEEILKKTQELVDFNTKSRWEHVKSLVAEANKIAGVVSVATKLGALYSAVPVGINSARASTVKYNQAIFSLGRAQGMYGKQLGSLESVFQRVRKDTVLSKNDFLEFADTMTRSYVGIKPGAEEMASFAADLQGSFGPSVELVKEKMQELMGIQNKWPALYDSVRKAQEASNKGDAVTLAALQKSIIARGYAIGLSQKEIDTMMQATMKRTKAENKSLELNTESAKVAQSSTDANIALGQAAEKAFIAGAKAAQVFYDTIQKIPGTAMSIAAIFGSMEIATTLWNSAKGADGLWNSLKGILGAKKDITSVGDELLGVKGFEKVRSVVDSLKGKFSAMKDEVSTWSKTFTSLKTSYTDTLGGLKASLLSLKNAPAAAISGLNVLWASLKAGTVATIQFTMALMANPLTWLAIAAAAAAYSLYSLHKAMGEAKQAGEEETKSLGELNAATKSFAEVNRDLASRARGMFGEAFDKAMDWNKLQKETAGMDPMQRNVVTLKRMKEAIKACGGELGANGAVISKNIIEFNKLNIAFTEGKKNLENELEILNSITGSLKEQINIAKEFGNIDPMLLDVNTEKLSDAYNKVKSFGSFLQNNIADQIANLSGTPLMIDTKLPEPEQLKQVQEQLVAITRAKTEEKKNAKTQGEKDAIQLQIDGYIRLSKEVSSYGAMRAKAFKEGIEGQITQATAQFKSTKEINASFESQLALERELMEMSQFGMGASVQMMQKQVDMMVTMNNEAVKQKENLDAVMVADKMGLGITKEQLEMMKKTKDAVDAQRKAEELASKVQGKTPAQQKELSNALTQYAKQQRDYTREQMEYQKKILELTKQIREGYLDALREMSFGAGEFSEIIATQSESTEEMVRQVTKFSGGMNMNTMALGGITAKGSEGYGARTMYGGQYTMGGYVGPGDQVWGARNTDIAGYQQSIDESNKMKAGQATGSVGTGVGPLAEQGARIQQEAAQKSGAITIEASKEGKIQLIDGAKQGGEKLEQSAEKAGKSIEEAAKNFLQMVNPALLKGTMPTGSDSTNLNPNNVVQFATDVAKGAKGNAVPSNVPQMPPGVQGVPTGGVSAPIGQPVGSTGLFYSDEEKKGALGGLNQKTEAQLTPDQAKWRAYNNRVGGIGTEMGTPAATPTPAPAPTSPAQPSIPKTKEEMDKMANDMANNIISREARAEKRAGIKDEGPKVGSAYQEFGNAAYATFGDTFSDPKGWAKRMKKGMDISTESITGGNFNEQAVSDTDIEKIRGRRVSQPLAKGEIDKARIKRLEKLGHFPGEAEEMVRGGSQPAKINLPQAGGGAAGGGVTRVETLDRKEVTHKLEVGPKLNGVVDLQTTVNNTVGRSNSPP